MTPARLAALRLLRDEGPLTASWLAFRLWGKPGAAGSQARRAWVLSAGAYLGKLRAAHLARKNAASGQWTLTQHGQDCLAHAELDLLTRALASFKTSKTTHQNGG